MNRPPLVLQFVNFFDQIREHAERELFKSSAFLSMPSVVEADPLRREDQAFIRKYLTVIDFTSTGKSKDGQSFSFGALIDRLKGIAEILDTFSDTSNETKGALPISHLWPWLV